MDKDEKQRIWHESIERFGVRTQSVVCMEECAELIQAISKRLRGKPDPNENLIEEMADVTICLGLLKEMYDIPDMRLDAWIDAKTRRQAKRNKA